MGQKKNLVRIFLGSTHFGSEIFLGRKNWGRNFLWVNKNWGRKFGLAKFYFGLIRFVCVMLLVTAKLNYNNTEFLWVGGGLPHNVVKPTYTWLWLSLVLTILQVFLVSCDYTCVDLP